MYTIPIVVLGILGTIPGGDLPDSHTPSSVQVRACPPATEYSEGRVRIVLFSSLIDEMRARFDLGSASGDDIQLLENDRDRATCNALWRALDDDGIRLHPGDAVTFYRSGNRYFAPVSRRLPDQGVRLDGGSFLAIYDDQFRLIGRFTS